MNVSPTDIAASHAVSWHTARRWFLRAEKVGNVPLHRVGRRLVADAAKLRAWIPPPRRKLVGVAEAQRIEAQVSDFQRRLDAEVRDRLALERRVRDLERRLARGSE